MGRLLVARAEAADAPALHAVFERVIAEDRTFVCGPDEFPLTPEALASQIARLNSADNGIYLGAWLERRLVGGLVIAGGDLRRTRHVGRLEIYVDATARRRGVGRALMGVAIAWAEENPTLRKLSLAVFEDNAPAVALYRALGFQEEGRRPGEYLERDGRLRADLLMWRSV